MCRLCIYINILYVIESVEGSDGRMQLAIRYCEVRPQTADSCVCFTLLSAITKLDQLLSSWLYLHHPK